MIVKPFRTIRSVCEVVWEVAAIPISSPATFSALLAILLCSLANGAEDGQMLKAVLDANEAGPNRLLSRWLASLRERVPTRGKRPGVRQRRCFRSAGSIPNSRSEPIRRTADCRLGLE